MQKIVTKCLPALRRLAVPALAAVALGLGASAAS